LDRHCSNGAATGSETIRFHILRSLGGASFGCIRPYHPNPAAAGASSSQKKEPRKPNPVLDAYLVLFNAVSAGFWAYTLVLALQHLAAGGATDKLYPVIEKPLFIAQTLALLELLHSLLGLVRSPFISALVRRCFDRLRTVALFTPVRRPQRHRPVLAAADAGLFAHPADVGHRAPGARVARVLWFHPHGCGKSITCSHAFCHAPLTFNLVGVAARSLRCRAGAWLRCPATSSTPSTSWRRRPSS
jgi:hypothetical protein